MTTTRHGSWSTVVVLFVTWTGGCAAPNLDCCEDDLAAYVPSLTCWKACSFRRVPAPLPPKLTGLRIEQQDIANIKVGDFPRHNVLERLYIKESNVVALQPGAFVDLSSVYALDLGQNKIRRLEAETFKGLGRLVYLNLDHNQIHHINRKAFVGIVSIRRLHLAWNCLSSVPQGIRSTVKLSVRLAGNPITSIPDVDELRHIDSLYMPTAKGTELQCDCKLRKIKRWLREYSRWIIRCVVNATVQYVQRVDWEDLRCASPDVSITLDTRASTGDTFTCQTDCREGLTFVWITPSGDYRPPSYEFSQNYTHVSNSSCKGSPVTRLETRRMCYSVLSVPGAGGDVEGTYTCLVTADHTDNASASVILTVSGGTMEKSTTRAYSQELQTTARVVTPPDKGVEEETVIRPDLELSTTQLVLVGLSSFCGCTVIVVVLAAYVSWYHGKEARQADRANRGRAARDGHNGTDDRGGHHENDDQFSDRNDNSRNHYENDSQFPDTDGARNAQYENDDEFSDTNGASGGHYENDEFSDTEGAKGGHYENEDQFSDTGGTREAHYENDDQFSDDDPSKHLQMTAPGQQASNTPARTSSAARAKRKRHRHNKRGLVKSRATSSNKPAAAASNIVIFHAEVHASGHYDNESKDGGQNSSDSNARTASANGVSGNKEQSGHYDNYKTAKGSANKTDDDSDSSDHDYMSLPENKVEGREVGHKDPVSPSASAAEVSENEYVTLPGTENDGEISDHTYVTLPGTENAGENSDHTYMTLPGTKNDDENSDHAHMTLPGMEHDHKSDHTYNVAISSTENPGDNSDHTYNVTIQVTENPAEQQMKREKEDEQISANFVTALSDSNDTDHVYVTVPDNAEEQQGKTDVKEKIQASDVVKQH